MERVQKKLQRKLPAKGNKENLHCKYLFLTGRLIKKKLFCFLSEVKDCQLETRVPFAGTNIWCSTTATSNSSSSLFVHTLDLFSATRRFFFFQNHYDFAEVVPCKSELANLSSCMPIFLFLFKILDAPNFQFVLRKTGLCKKRHQQLMIAVAKARDCGYLTFDVPHRVYDYSEYIKQ